MKTADFLQAVYGESSGYATIVTKGSSGELTDQKFFEYPEQRDAMVAFASDHSKEDVY